MQRTIFHGWSRSTKKVAFAVTKSMRLYRKLKKEFPDAKGCQVDSEYYAAGIYGCIGRLSKVTVLDSEWNSNGKSFYIYF